MIQLKSLRMVGVLLFSGILIAAVACSSEDPTPVPTNTSAPASDTATATSDPTEVVSDAPGTGGSAVGFIFVGPRDDFGYNQAAYIGSEAVEESFPDLEILRAENVPENQEAERVLESMVQSGAKILFPTSFGHLDPAIEVANRHDDVIVMHQGGLKTTSNVGSYFGDIWETVYLSGMAAGAATETGKLGYVVAFPIPQVLLNVNAFTLGAQAVNPDVETTVVFTASWCDPGLQTQAAETLIDAGVDVLTQHQDCTKTIVEAAERAGVKTVGYHADASSLAPEGWLTGAVWDWGDLFVEMTETIDTGAWSDSDFNGRFRLGIESGVVQLAPFGESVSEETREMILDAQDGFLSGDFNPFTGPVLDQDGNVQIEDGVSPDIEMLESTDYLVEGVIGEIPG